MGQSFRMCPTLTRWRDSNFFSGNGCTRCIRGIHPPLRSNGSPSYIVSLVICFRPRCPSAYIWEAISNAYFLNNSFGIAILSGSSLTARLAAFYISWENSRNGLNSVLSSTGELLSSDLMMLSVSIVDSLNMRLMSVLSDAYVLMIYELEAEQASGVQSLEGALSRLKGCSDAERSDSQSFEYDSLS